MYEKEDKQLLKFVSINGMIIKWLQSADNA